MLEKYSGVNCVLSSLLGYFLLQSQVALDTLAV